MSQSQSPACPTVELINNRPATTSLKIAECFGKRHDHVMRDIQALIEQCPPDFSAPNFGAAEYKDEQGKPRPMHTVYFDGFMLLVMGYTGKKALAMKLAYIAAFNAMREKLEAEKAQKPLRDRQASLPAKNKYEAYIEEVEEFRARTVSEMHRLLDEGLNLVDVRKFGPDGIVGFTPIIANWLKIVATEPIPLVSSWHNMERAIRYSPLCLMKRMEEHLSGLRK